MKRSGRKKGWHYAGLLICLLLFLISVFQIVRYFADSRKADKEFAQLARMEEGSPLEKYEKLHKENQDMAGWIYIEGTKIDYPVMYTPKDPDFYLKHNFDREKSDHGVPYIAGQCDPEKPSDHIIIYGHHMKDGSMFADLMEYQDSEFYKKHRRIRFDTLTQTAEYEVIAVCKITADETEGFPYAFVDAETPEDYDAYIDQCKNLALYDTGVDAEYGDKLITLSTCEYSQEDGRLIVVAKKSS